MRAVIPMQVVDEAIEPALAHATTAWLSGQTLRFGWKARSESAGTFWHRNYVLPGIHPHHYDNRAVDVAMTFERFVDANTPLSRVAQLISDRFFAGRALTRVWVNAQSFGDEAAIHRDFPQTYLGRSRTVVWYPVVDWDPEWGGDFCLFDDAREIVCSVVVRPNRAVVFDGTALHGVRPLSRYCPSLRVAISFGLELAHD
jgi:SM-20-related protein